MTHRVPAIISIKYLGDIPSEADQKKLHKQFSEDIYYLPPDNMFSGKDVIWYNPEVNSLQFSHWLHLQGYTAEVSVVYDFGISWPGTEPTPPSKKYELYKPDPPVKGTSFTKGIVRFDRFYLGTIIEFLTDLDSEPAPLVVDVWYPYQTNKNNSGHSTLTTSGRLYNWFKNPTGTFQDQFWILSGEERDNIYYVEIESTTVKGTFKANLELSKKDISKLRKTIKKKCDIHNHS